MYLNYYMYILSYYAYGLNAIYVCWNTTISRFRLINFLLCLIVFDQIQNYNILLKIFLFSLAIVYDAGFLFHPFLSITSM